MVVARRMTRNPVTISPKASIQEAIQLMKRHAIRHLPVVDQEKRLVGWISDSDLRGVIILDDRRSHRGRCHDRRSHHRHTR